MLAQSENVAVATMIGAIQRRFRVSVPLGRRRQQQQRILLSWMMACLLVWYTLVAFVLVWWLPNAGSSVSSRTRDVSQVRALPNQRRVVEPTNSTATSVAAVAETARSDTTTDTTTSTDTTGTTSTTSTTGSTSANRTTDRHRVWEQLQSAGVSEATLRHHAAVLPTWSTVVAQYGEYPVLLGSEDDPEEVSDATATANTGRTETLSSSSSASRHQQQQRVLQRTCRAYQDTVQPERRVLAAAGMFSTGTNLVTQLLKHNCYIPERFQRYGGRNATKEQLGIRWQVPWGKHTPAHFKWKHAATEKASAIDKNDVLPIVTVRHPWRWMQSMCQNPYAAHWPHHHTCPNLVVTPAAAWTPQQQQRDGTEQASVPSNWNQVTVKYGVGTESYPSLVHLWNNWYHGYTNVSLLPGNDENGPLPPQDESSSSSLRRRRYPWIMVRMEDLVFHTVETIATVCECAGGRLYDHQPFQYITESAKADSPGHDTSTGLTEAWIKYSQPLTPGAGFTTSDYTAALEALDGTLMERLQYQHPPKPREE